MKKDERTPEERERARRINALVMMILGGIMAACGVAGGLIILSGRGDLPDWMFGGKPAAVAPGGTWTNFAPRVGFAPWGKDAFARARAEKKLVLLFLGPDFNAATARMKAETFGDPAVGALVEREFVAVGVDAAARPDLDRRYRAGGWPTVALLLDDGTVADATTFLGAGEFLRWASARADADRNDPKYRARAREMADAARAAVAADLGRTAAVSSEAAELSARTALLSAWDAKRGTFDARGPRFPRWERIVALRALKKPWADALSLEAAKAGDAFADASDGGLVRALTPDGVPAARERVAGDQASALRALCGLRADAAKRELEFLASSFESKGPTSWRGWQAGYALAADRKTAADGADFPTVREDGWWPMGAATPAEDAALSAAVLACPEASPILKTRARATIARLRDGAGLEEAVAVGAARLAAGDRVGALRSWKTLAALADGPAYRDRAADGVLPPETDRLLDAELNARALAFLEDLSAAAPAGKEKDAIAARARTVASWLSARSERLDPAVWAALAARVP